MKKNDFIERSMTGALSFLQESVFADAYASRNGFLQARDPRLKVLSLLFLLLAVLFSRNIFFILSIYMVCLLCALFSSLPLGFFLKRTWIFIPFFSFFIALPALFSIVTPGKTVLSFKVFSFSLFVTEQGLASASIFVMRVLTSVSLTVLLALTTRHYALLRVLRVFRVPEVFVMTLGMCYRYIYLFIEILQNTFLAIKSRVGHVSSIRQGQGVVTANIASLWQRSYHLQGQVYQAMLSRGFTGEPRVLDDFRAAPKDWACLAAAVLILGQSL